MNPQKRRRKAEALVGSGRACHDRGDLAAAEQLYRQAIELFPGHVDGNYFLGTLLAETGRLADGITTLRRAEQLSPDSPLIKLNLATALQLAGESQAALDYFRAAEALGLQSHELLNNLGILCCRLGKYLEAQAYLRRLVDEAPDFAPGLLAFARLHQHLGDIQTARDYAQRAFERSGGNPRFGSALLMISMYDATLSAADRLAAHRQVAARFPAKPAALRRPRRAPPWRVGFVSPDLGEHSVSFFLTPLIEAIDCRRVQCFFYSNKARQDAVSARLKAHADGWREIAAASDEQVCQAIAADGVDVLVDLAGHTADNRLGVVARRAAPVQASFIGYPGTTGLATIDYILSDATLDPPGEESAYSEAIYRLPFFCCYRPPEVTPAVSPMPCRDGRPPNFGVFHGGAKLTPDNLTLWGRLLHACPRSTLMVMCKGATDPLLQQRLRVVLEGCGVSAERLRFREFAGFSEYLDALSAVDICLDALPWNGHTVTCHALWMGVPTLTLVGDRRAGRMGADLMAALGLGEFVTRDANEFVAAGIALVEDPGRLADLRAGLRQRLMASVITDASAHASAFADFVDFAVTTSLASGDFA